MTSQEPTAPVWADADAPVHDRVRALMSAMTLDEKIAQLGSRWVFDHVWSGPEDPTHRVAPVSAMADADSASGLADAARHGLGQLTRVYGSFPVSVADGAEALVRRQRVVLEGSRLGIPAVVHEECLTGLTALGATVYPAPLAWGAAFDPDLVERMAAAIGRDMVRLGIHQGLAPVLDVVRDYRWGRVEECIGEDPYLVATVGTAYVRGLEQAGLVSTLKHFAGYSASRGARNHAPVSMGRRELREVVLPPFEAAVVEGGARSVMASYTDVDGVPCAADAWLLSDVLRGEWSFDGTVVADYGGVPMLATQHRVVGSVAEAGGAALTAGLDVELPDTAAFGDELVQRVRDGLTEPELVDRAVERVLRQKIALGLLDEGWTPEGSVARAAEVDLDGPENRAVARELAQRSIVLLDAGDALPLRAPGRPGPGRVAVVGPAADDARSLLGCYAFPNHVLPRFPSMGTGLDIVTPLDAVRAELPDAEVAHEPGCAFQGEDRSGFPAAVAVAQQADVCLVLVGDRAGMFGAGTSGEGCDATDLRLPGVQQDLVEAVAATGTPVVLVVVSGRPYALGSLSRQVAAVVQAFFPGAEGGTALAGVLSGAMEPGGRLPVQVPRTADQVLPYLQPPLGQDGFQSTLVSDPLYPFGHGRSYARFDLDEVRLSAGSMPTDGQVSVSLVVTNAGERDGEEVVQLYLHDPVARVARPSRQLIGFARVRLRARESAEVAFEVHADRTAYVWPDQVRGVDPGDVVLAVGTSARDIVAELPVRMTGAARPVGRNRRMSTPSTVTIRTPAS